MAGEPSGGPEFEGTGPQGLEQQQPAGTIQLEDEDGTIWFVKPDQIESVIPPKEQETIEGLRSIADQIIMHHFPVDEIIDMQQTGKTKEDIDERFKQAVREYLQNIAIHRAGRDYMRFPDSGTLVYMDRGDLDGRAAVGLLRMADVKINVAFVQPGEYVPGYHNIDTGYKSGFAIGAEGENVRYNINWAPASRITTYADHHGGEVPRDISGTERTYEMLTRWGLLDENQPGLKEAVHFINERDNGRTPVDHYPDSYQTLWGLADELEVEDIIELMSQGVKPDQPLTKEQLEHYRLIEYDEGGKPIRNVPKRLRGDIERNIRGRENAEKYGRVLRSNIYGKVMIGGTTKGAIRWEARGPGVESVLNWRNGGEEGVTFSSERDLTPETKKFFKEAGIQNVKSTMATKVPLIFPAPVPVSFRETLATLGIPESEWRSRDINEMIKEDDQRINQLRARK